MALNMYGALVDFFGNLPSYIQWVFGPCLIIVLVFACTAVFEGFCTLFGLFGFRGGR